MIIKEFPVYNFNKNGNNNIKNKVQFETISEMNNSSRVIIFYQYIKMVVRTKKIKLLESEVIRLIKMLIPVFII